MESFLQKAEDAFKDVKEALKGTSEEDPQQDDGGAVEQQAPSNYRFQSFAPQTTGSVKWYVDGASYFHAVSLALEGMGC